MKVMLIVLLFTWKGFFTTNMSPKVKQWINITMLSLWSNETRRLSQEAKEMGILHIGSASRQWTCTHRSLGSGFFFFSKSCHSCGSATTQLPWKGSLWLLAVAQT
jgi:hypothetical protein